MWIFIILIVVAVILFRNYNSDKKELHSRIEQKGGMDRIFLDFITCIEDDFSKHKIIVNSNTELELSATTADNKTFYFGIKLGFGNKVNYRCDTKRSNFLNADILIEGNKSNQVAPYMMIIDELRKKHSFITNEENCNDELDKVQSTRNDFHLVPTPSAPTIKSHFKQEYTSIKLLSTSNSHCTIHLEDFTERKFNVLEFQVLDLKTKSVKENPLDIDTSMNLMVFSLDKGEDPNDSSHYLFLECSDNITCDLKFNNDEQPDEFAIIDQNKVIVYSVVESTYHLT